MNPNNHETAKARNQEKENLEAVSRFRGFVFLWDRHLGFLLLFLARGHSTQARLARAP